MKREDGWWWYRFTGGAWEPVRVYTTGRGGQCASRNDCEGFEPVSRLEELGEFGPRIPSPDEGTVKP